MSDHESIVDYFKQIQILINGMEARNEELADQQIVGKVY